MNLFVVNCVRTLSVFSVITIPRIWTLQAPYTNFLARNLFLILTQLAGFTVPDPSLTSHVTYTHFLNVSESQLPHL